MTTSELKERLTDEQIILILKEFGVEDFKEDEKSIQFPTICHNADPDGASLKLYYYKDTKLFHCYTECGETFDIFGLLERAYDCRGIEKSFGDIVALVKSYISDERVGFFLDIHPYQKMEKKRKRVEILLPQYSEDVMDCFVPWFYQGWIDEGISIESMKKYNIKYSIAQNKVIIPHYDVGGRLVGIRGRALNEEDIALGKYRPITIEDCTYAHQLSLNLYGLNLSKEAIDRSGTVVIFEGEKSVLLYDSIYKENNSVAVCGSSLNKNQILLLLKHTKAKNIVIAFDKEYENNDWEKRSSYLDKLRKIGDKYKAYFNMFYIADKENLLKLKDSPIDRGRDVFEHLMERKMQIF